LHNNLKNWLSEFLANNLRLVLLIFPNLEAFYLCLSRVLQKQRPLVKVSAIKGGLLST
jgi:hypothetical protein